KQGVSILNVNGLPNLIAWIRSLDGHIVPHSRVPDDFGSGGICRMMIDTSMVRSLRQEAADRVDRHSAQTVDGEWIEVRKTDASLFHEDRLLPLYASTERISENGFPLVFITPSRRWWCE